MKIVSMKPVVQKPCKDGFWAVYIRFTLDGWCHFWKTSKVVSFLLLSDINFLRV